MRQTLLVQLPIPPPGPQPVEGNVPLAAAYLKLLARRRGLERRFGTGAVNCPMETRNEMYKHEYWTTTIGFLAAAMLLVQAAVQVHAAEPVSLDDGRLRIAVDSARGSLDGIIDLAADHDHIDQSGAQTIGSFAAATAQLTLPARRACLIEFTPR